MFIRESGPDIMSLGLLLRRPGWIHVVGTIIKLIQPLS